MFRRRYLGVPLLTALSVVVSFMLLSVDPPQGAIDIGIADAAITVATDRH